MNHIKSFFILSFFCLSLTSNTEASICQSFLSIHQHDLKRAWQEYLLTDPEGEISLKRKNTIENYFINILVSNYIYNFRPDLVNQRDLAMDLISSDIDVLKAYISFKRLLIYAKFEDLKKHMVYNPEEYKSHLSALSENIDSLTGLILEDLAY